MATRLPNRNLPPEAQAWGREIEALAQGASSRTDRLAQDLINAFKGVNSVVAGLSKQVETLNTLTQELQAQQAALQSQQSQIATAFAELEAIASREVTARTYAAPTAPAGPLAPGQNLTSLTVSVPSGFSRAHVLAISSVISSGQDHAVGFCTRIAGNNGPVMYSGASGPGDMGGTGSSSHALTLTGLSGGDTITIQTRVVDTILSPLGTANSSAVVVYLK